MLCAEIWLIKYCTQISQRQQLIQCLLWFKSYWSTQDDWHWNVCMYFVKSWKIIPIIIWPDTPISVATFNTKRATNYSIANTCPCVRWYDDSPWPGNKLQFPFPPSRGFRSLSCGIACNKPRYSLSATTEFHTKEQPLSCKGQRMLW